MKACIRCGSPVDCSLCSILSTNRVSPRLQRWTTSLPFCSSCLQRFCQANDPQVWDTFSRQLYEAFTELREDVKALLQNAERANP